MKVYLLPILFAVSLAQAPHPLLSGAYSGPAPAIKPDVYEAPKPYKFAYEVKDEYGNEHHRQESSDEYGNVQGVYGYTDAYGLFRQVEYTADDYGFKASIKTNEPGTDNKNPADVEIYADPSPIKYEEPAKPHPAIGKVVADAPSYQAVGYAAPGRDYGIRPRRGPAVPHRRGYRGPSAHNVATGQRGYGHAAGLNQRQHAGGVVYAAPVVHRDRYEDDRRIARRPLHQVVARTHQRGYDGQSGGYGHSNNILSHKPY